MDAEPLMKFKSHIAGKNAEVAIFRDRIEWNVEKTVLHRNPASEIIPMKNVSSVTMARDGFRNHKVTVVTTGNTIELRTDKSEAEEAKTLLTQLMLGSHPSQAAGAPLAPPGPTPVGTTAAPTAGLAEELAKLAALRDQGVLTEAEFAAQKTRLLG